MQLLLIDKRELVGSALPEPDFGSEWNNCKCKTGLKSGSKPWTENPCKASKGPKSQKAQKQTPSADVPEEQTGVSKAEGDGASSVISSLYFFRQRS